MKHARRVVGGTIIHADNLELVRDEPLAIDTVNTFGDEPFAIIDRNNDGKQWVCHEAVCLLSNAEVVEAHSSQFFFIVNVPSVKDEWLIHRLFHYAPTG